MTKMKLINQIMENKSKLLIKIPVGNMLEVGVHNIDFIMFSYEQVGLIIAETIYILLKNANSTIPYDFLNIHAKTIIIFE